MRDRDNDFTCDLTNKGNRAVVKSLGKNVIAEVRPREVPSSQYLMDPLIDKVPELGKDKEFSLGTGDFVVIVVIPLLVNWLSATVQGGLAV